MFSERGRHHTLAEGQAGAHTLLGPYPVPKVGEVLTR